MAAICRFCKTEFNFDNSPWAHGYCTIQCYKSKAKALGLNNEQMKDWQQIHAILVLNKEVEVVFK